MKSIKPIVLLSSLAVLAACSTPTPQPVVEKKPEPQPQTTMPMPHGMPAAPAHVLPAYLDPNNPISSQRSVYFDFDKYAIKSADESLLQKHGAFLSANPAVNIKIEGNTDERGTAEYNLALGQKRAESVRQALKVDGVKDSQMEAISYGKQKPKAEGHDEAAWAQNRRADIIYPAR